MAYEAYNARNEYLGYSTKDRKTKAVLHRLDQMFEGDPSFHRITVLHLDGTTSIRRFRVINESFVKQLNPERVYSKYIIPHPDENLEAGTILLGIANRDWIVTAITELGDIIQQGMIQKLNYTLKWQHEGIIYYNPVVVNGVSRLNDGVDSNHYLTYGDELIKMRLPNNEKTQTIKRDKRVFIYDTPYKITKIDEYTDENIFNYILREEFIGPNDNVELGLCDYQEADDSIPVEDAIIGNDLISFGQSYEYSFNNFSDNVFVNNWSLDHGDYVEAFNPDSEKINIKVVNDYNNIGKNFTLIAFLNDSNIITKNIIITSLV